MVILRRNRLRTRYKTFPHLMIDATKAIIEDDSRELQVYNLDDDSTTRITGYQIPMVVTKYPGQIVHAGAYKDVLIFPSSRHPVVDSCDTIHTYDLRSMSMIQEQRGMSCRGLVTSRTNDNQHVYFSHEGMVLFDRRQARTVRTSSRVDMPDIVKMMKFDNMAVDLLVKSPQKILTFDLRNSKMIEQWDDMTEHMTCCYDSDTDEYVVSDIHMDEKKSWHGKNIYGGSFNVASEWTLPFELNVKNGAFGVDKCSGEDLI
jgi:hypothetical protein